MRHAVIALFAQLWWIGAAGCSNSPSGTMPGPSDAMPVPPDAMPVPREVKDIPVTPSHDLDLLFLVDDSPSMADKQRNLASNFPAFIDTLSTLQGGLPSVHIGVVTSDMGTRGEDGQPPGQAIPPLGAGGCSGSGKDGVLQLFGATGQVSGGPFISDIADPVTGMRLRNYTGTLIDVFAQMAHAGAGGCGFAQHLAAVKRTLVNPANAGFLRPDASLGVIILANEDDCSIEHSTLLASDAAALTTLGPLGSFRCTRFGVQCSDGGQTPDAMNQVGIKNQCRPSDTSAYLATVTDYVEFLRGLKSDPSKVIVAAIAGSLAPFATELRTPRTGQPGVPALAHACTYVGGDGQPEFADPPIRIKSFLDQFPNRSKLATICRQDLSGGLQQIGDLLKTALGDPCLEGRLADTDPSTPGPQQACDVTVTDPARTAQVPVTLPRCTPEDATATNQPCWHLATDPASCPTGDHVKIVVEGESTLPLSAHVIASCIIVPATVPAT